PWELEERQADTVDLELVLVDPHRIGRQESLASHESVEVVLIYAVAAHAQSPDQGTVFIEPDTSWEEDNAILKRILGLASIRARIGGIKFEQIKKWPRSRGRVRNS